MKADTLVNTESRQQLNEAAGDAQIWLTNAIDVLGNQPFMLRSLDTRSAFETLAASVDGLDWLNQFAHAAHELGDVTTENGESAFSKFSPELMTVTTELVSAMEISDKLLLADLVEYELVPLLERFRTATNELIA